MADKNDKTDASIDSFVSISITSQRSYGDSGIAGSPSASYSQHNRSRFNSNLTRLSSISDDMELEPALIHAETPLNFEETEEITVLGIYCFHFN